MAVTAQRVSNHSAPKPIILEPITAEKKEEAVSIPEQEQEKIYDPPVIREVRYFSHPVRARRNKLGVGAVLIIQLIAVIALGISVWALLNFSDESVGTAVKNIVGEFT